MAVCGRIIKGKYYDSVSLMTLSKRLLEVDGVKECVAVMGTLENKAVLESSGLIIPEFKESIDTDLLIAIQADDENLARQALAAADNILAGLVKADNDALDSGPWSLEGAFTRIPDANLALISVSGKYAAGMAMNSLRLGIHVMLFSDNVPLKSEIELKRFAREKGLLVMGPDCGTAIINGVPLGFANVVNRGNIGIVAASGTGLQEVSCLISNNGAGISQAIGTGSRDLKSEVGAITFLEATNLLLADDATGIILLISKPPDHSVVEKIAAVLKDISKPVVTVFLGQDSDLIKGENVHSASTLEESALLAVALSLGENPDKVHEKIVARDRKLQELATTEVFRVAKGRKFVRGLFSGGTFCSEAQLILKGMGLEISSNVPISGAGKLAQAAKASGHDFIDFGSDEFTVGKPHPMIDFSLRNKSLIGLATDAETAVILLDIVLGYGANENPLAEIIPAIIQARGIAASYGKCPAIICSVTGTNEDPQNRGRVVAELEKAGVSVAESNAAACKLAGFIAGKFEEKA